MSETAVVVYIDTVTRLNYNDFVNFIKRTEPDMDIIENKIKEVYDNVVNNRIFTSSGYLYQRTMIGLFEKYIVGLNGFVFSEVRISGWEPIICLLTKDPIERKIT